MRILVVTYYKDLNPGTFLQAFGVKTGLLSIFPNAKIQFLKSNYIKEETFENEISINKLQLFFNKGYNLIRKLKFKKFISEVFDETEEVFNYFDFDELKLDTFIKQFDLIVVGSDTILEKIATEDQIGIMWGDYSTNVKKITFAASGDNCVENKKQKQFHEKLSSSFSSFSFIGIRDDITKGFLENDLAIPSKSIIKQPDPTYILPLDKFKLKPEKIKKLKNIDKVAIFHFDRRFIYRQELAKLLQGEGYTLITPEYDPSCDISFKHLDPFEWGALFEHCDIVFTERFHDTVFALRYGKPVFTFDWNPSKYDKNGLSKRSEILKEYNLLNHHFILKSKHDLKNVPVQVRGALDVFNSDVIQKHNSKLIDFSKELLQNLKSLVN